MKNFQKFILPLLIIVIIIIIYFTYFAAKGLGSFSDFDPNNNANKEIVVRLVHEKGIQRGAEGTSFYAEDKNGVVYLIQGPAGLPAGFEQAENIKLNGHLTKEYFHAHGVSIE